MKVPSSALIAACCGAFAATANAAPPATAFMVECDDGQWQPTKLSVHTDADAKLVANIASEQGLAAETVAAFKVLGLVVDDAVITSASFALAPSSCRVHAKDHAVFACANGILPSSLHLSGKRADGTAFDAAQAVSVQLRQIRVVDAASPEGRYDAAISLQTASQSQEITYKFAQCFSNSR